LSYTLRRPSAHKLPSSKIATIALSIRHHIAVNTELKAIKFITCTLLPPPKKAVLAYLGIPLSPGGKPDTPVPIVRKAEVDVSGL
jgi:primary-amine oxidase